MKKLTNAELLEKFFTEEDLRFFSKKEDEDRTIFIIPFSANYFISILKRFVLPNAELTLHEPLLGNSVSGNASSMASISESLLATRKKLNGILAEHTGKTKKEIEADTRFDHYFSASEAIDYGLADSIVGMDALIERSA